MSGKETLESALETLELAALDALPVLPHDRVAVGHALADCEWCEEHFQRRGEEEVHEAMAILEREAYGNPDLHDREPEQAPVVPAPVAYEPER